MFEKKRIFDIIGAVIATLVATILIENFNSILTFFNFSFQIKLSVFVLTVLTVSFLSVMVARLILHKIKAAEISKKNGQLKSLHLRLEEFQEIASKDNLTNTYNSNQVEKALTNRTQISKERNLTFAGLLIDIDNFKKFNDNYGHEGGNEILKQVADLIRPRSAEDILIRYGGDEFLIFSKIGDTKQNGYGLGQRLKREIAEYEFLIDNKNLKREKVTISCGVTEFNPSQDTKESFLEKLSKALTLAKKNEDGTAKKNYVAVI